MISLEPVSLSERAAALFPSTLESVLFALVDGSIAHEGIEVLPVISIGYAVVEAADSGSSSKVYLLEGAPIRSIPPAQHTREWHETYVHDMESAVLFFDSLAKSEVSLLFQPIVAADNHDVILYEEALLRLPALAAIDGAVGGSNVLASVERLGLMRLVDRCVIHAVLDRLLEQPTLRLGCNLSAQSFVGDVWWNTAFERLAAQPCLASRLTVELTETGVLTDLDAAVSFSARLRSSGCRVAVDDLGAGFSSLTFVLTAKPDVIKIDRQFLRLARSERRGTATLQRLLQLCSLLAPHVVVEGVEYLDDLSIVPELRQSWLQGYLTGAPGKGTVPGPLKIYWR